MDEKRANTGPRPSCASAANDLLQFEMREQRPKQLDSVLRGHRAAEQRFKRWQNTQQFPLKMFAVILERRSKVSK